MKLDKVRKKRNTVVWFNSEKTKINILFMLNRSFPNLNQSDFVA